MSRTGVVLFSFLVALVAAPLAGASFIVDRDTSAVSLRIAGSRAIVDYRAGGTAKHVELWGAINARLASPSVPQVAFQRQYGVGHLAGGSCRPYTGPPLPLLVAACDAPDGSYWALQSWQRGLEDYGGASAPWELHASHWSGPLPQLEVWLNWSYDGRFQHLFGRLTYRDTGVYGFHSTRFGNPLDSYGRNVYLDTLNSAYGPGWHRDNGFLTHNPWGTFCYGLYPHGSHPSGAGNAYRITVEGPGATPVVSWQGEALGAYDATLDHQMNALERSFGDPQCQHS